MVCVTFYHNPKKSTLIDSGELTMHHEISILLVIACDEISYKRYMDCTVHSKYCGALVIRLLKTYKPNPFFT